MAQERVRLAQIKVRRMVFIRQTFFLEDFTLKLAL
jgi:hypothetical protein